jgi:hypothetical protein
MKNFDDTIEVLGKEHYVADIRRKKFMYETAFEGEAYHLVRTKDEPGFMVIPNTLDEDKHKSPAYSRTIDISKSAPRDF